MANIVYSVPDIHCSACEQSIQRALTLPGIHRVAVDVEGKQVSVDYAETETSPRELRQRLERAGFEVAED